MPRGNDPIAAKLRGLKEIEKRFVRALLDGLSHADAARKAGLKSKHGALNLLGRPEVQAALETIVPLAAIDDARAVEVLRPYLRARMVAACAGKSPATALRDFLSLGKQGAGEDPLRAWHEAQARRKQASTGTHGAGAGPRGMGEPPRSPGDSRLPS